MLIKNSQLGNILFAIFSNGLLDLFKIMFLSVNRATNLASMFEANNKELFLVSVVKFSWRGWGNGVIYRGNFSKFRVLRGFHSS